MRKKYFISVSVEIIYIKNTRIQFRNFFSCHPNELFYSDQINLNPKVLTKVHL